MTDLEPLIDAFLDEEFEANPVAASGLGLTAFDERLDDLSAGAFEARDAAAVRWLARLDDVATSRPHGGRGHRPRPRERRPARSPDPRADSRSGSAIPRRTRARSTSGLFGLFLHRLRPEAELVDAAVARLEQVAAGACEAGIANLDPALAHPLIVRARHARGAPAGPVRARPAAGEVADPAAARTLTEAGETAAARPSRRWAALPRGPAPAAAHGHLAARRGALLAASCASARRSATTLAALRERGQAEYDRLDAEMRAARPRAAGTRRLAGPPTRPTSDHPPTEEAMRRDLRGVDRARPRAFLAETGLVTLPDGETLRGRAVAGVPAAGPGRRLVQRAAGVLATAARATSSCPFAPDGASEEEIQKRLESNNYVRASRRRRSTRRTRATTGTW